MVVRFSLVSGNVKAVISCRDRAGLGTEVERGRLLRPPL